MVNPLKRTCGSISGRPASRFLLLGAQSRSAISAKFLPSPFPSSYFPIVTAAGGRSGGIKSLRISRALPDTGINLPVIEWQIPDRSTFFNESNRNTFRTPVLRVMACNWICAGLPDDVIALRTSAPRWHHLFMSHSYNARSSRSCARDSNSIERSSTRQTRFREPICWPKCSGRHTLRKPYSLHSEITRLT